MKIQNKGALVAAAAAMLVLSGEAKAADPAEGSAPEVKCTGINSCKAQGLCHTDTHACAGLNSCKGKGWIKVTEEECKKQGGEIYS